jgi:prenylcysteine oxidase/farnesylcysteine lyase
VLSIDSNPTSSLLVVIQFNSLSYLRALNTTEEGGEQEHVVKIFSAEELSDAKLEKIFGQDQVKWIHRKVWDAYPCKSLRNPLA